MFTIKNVVVNEQFSILIPFRNEAENITALVQSLQQLNYPKDQFEVLFIDDNSTDNSVAILEEYLLKNINFKLLKNKRKSNSPKKDALNTAIQVADFKWIITTDADCEVPKNWLLCYGEYIDANFKKNGNNQNLKMIAGPVGYKTNKPFLQKFQNLDFLSLIGSTIGAFGISKPFLCNGANLCYKKHAFLAVKGFDGNDNIASGDDVFLMEKILLNYPESVHYLKSKEVIVTTKPESTFKGLLNQRIRWGSKTLVTKNRFGKFVGVLVFLMNFVMVMGFGFITWNCFTDVYRGSQRFTEVFLLIFILKFNIDFLLIQKTYRFIGIKNGLKSYVFSSLLYPFFVVLVVFLSFFKKYEWKERVFQK